jgi:hypothetical protein
MSKGDEQDILVMALFVVTRSVVLDCASEVGIPEEQLTTDLIELVRRRISQVLGDWRDSVRDMVKETIEKQAVKCPLGLVCSPSCAYRQVGECALLREVKQGPDSLSSA